MPATRATSSAHRSHESQASPLGSAQGVPSACSHSHQSLLTLPPSIWWEEVATPQRNPSGKESPVAGWSRSPLGAIGGTVADGVGEASGRRRPPTRLPHRVLRPSVSDDRGRGSGPIVELDAR